MEKVFDIAGKKIRCRRLRWKERMELEAGGIDFNRIDGKSWDPLAKTLLDTCCLEPDKLGELDIVEAYDLAYEVLDFSFIKEADRKNS